MRIESDGLGQLAVPAEALYGIHTARSLQNLSFSQRPLGSCPPYVRALSAVKIAAARANAAAGVLDPAPAAAIEIAARRLETLPPADLPADLLGGGGSIGVHMNINEVVANLANEHLGRRRGEYEPVTRKHVGASQSTADVCHTAIRLAVLERGVELGAVLDRCVATLANRAAAFDDVPTLARTCLQDALPTTLGVLFHGYSALFARRRREVHRSLEPLCGVTLGGTVIGTGEGAPARYRARVVPILAEITGHRLEPRRELPDAMQNSDDLGALSSAVAQLAEGVMKIARDIRLLASGPKGGFGELRLPPTQEGSSFFAAKQNPVVAETLLQCGFQVLGHHAAVSAARTHAELYLDLFDGLIGINVLDAMGLLAVGLDRFEARCLRELSADEQRCRELAALGRGPG